MKLKQIRHKIAINVTAQRMWQVLSQYGDVALFHAGVVESHSVAGSQNRASPGAERVCHIVDMGLPITLKERITEYNEGQSYSYEVYEWKNFPLRKMQFSFRILNSDHAYIELEIVIAYKAKPFFLTPLLAGKMSKLAQGVLLGYKHYAETGEARVPIKQLKAQYPSRNPRQVQFQ